ncbi:P-II family nitrogen regulator [Heliobacterium chlorum]|uniref:GlnB-like protein 2 n=1 Tax=Heliobacterium chlorum TaxID=2698 RepID=Q53UA2_HELCL|nr:P-II family nitrogen regulator [Heliobacterium chlorum]MBC9785149.1 P-II family nitrogen regulator [Heliobacterium chlorum]BAD95752.1 nifI2 [Heliobacterium chlorum]BAE93901.1 GlnB-like protein 2 [Heliobacterium chlorum]
MKEIVAFIRRHQLPATKKALEEAGFPAMTIQSVEGRGKQKGIGGWAAEVDPEMNKFGNALQNIEPEIKWIPKRMITIIVQDDQVSSAVDAIMLANKTGHIGDGKIFVCPMEEVVRVRTEERGAQAVS